MRLFLGIKPPRPAEAELAQTLMRLQSAAGAAAAALKWTPASNIHATLHFLGEVNPARADVLRAALQPRLAEPPFEMSLGKVGVFPPTGGPRVVWLDVVDGAEAVARIHAELATRLRDQGFAIESRPYTPHLTIARVQDRDRSQAKGLRERFRDVECPRIAWTVDRVTLFKSDLTGPVPRYDELQETALASHVS